MRGFLKHGLIAAAVSVALTAAGAANAQYAYNQSGAILTSPDVSRASLNNVAGKISSRLANFNRRFGTGNVAQQTATLDWSSDDAGLSGGTGANPHGVWVSTSYTDLSDENSATAYEGELYNVVAGYDYNLDRYNMIVGAAFNVEAFDANTSFNTGSQTHIGVGITPYFAWRFWNFLSVSAMANYTRVTGESIRNEFGGVNIVAQPAGIAGREIRESYNSDRYFVAANVNANYIWRFLSIDARAGVQWQQEWLDADPLREQDDSGLLSQFGGNNNQLGQFIVEMKPGMFFKVDRNSYIKPYLMSQYQLDFTNVRKKFANPLEGRANNDTAGLLVGAGMDLFSARGFHFNIEWSGEVIREDLGENTISAYFRMDF